MGNFNRDLHAEVVLGEYLDAYFYPNIQVQKFKRIKDLDSQLSGIDVLIMSENERYKIDEKGYLSRPTIQDTFVLELSYLSPSGNRTEGWLFDPNKVTTHYLLCWADRDDIDLKKLSVDNIHTVEAILVNREILKSYLWNQYELNREFAYKKVNQLLEQETKSSIELPDSFSKIMVSNQLREKPVNIVMPKDEYLKSGAVEAWFKIDRKGVKRLTLPDYNTSDSVNVSMDHRSR